MSTRPTIRQNLLDEDITGGLHGTATAGAAGTLIDTTLLQIGGQSVSRFKSFYLYRPNAANTEDVFRRVNTDGYAPTTGVLTHGGPNYTEAPLAGDPADDGTYELWPFNPREVNRAFSRGLTTRCFSIQQDDITTNGQTRYQMNTSPFPTSGITSPQNQILEFGHVLGTDPNATVIPWLRGGRTWWPENDDDTLFVRFHPAPSGTLRMMWKQPYTDITDESTSTAADDDYIMWAMAFELFMALRKRAIKNSESAANYAEMERDSYTRFWARRQMFLDRFASQFHYAKPKWRSAVASPLTGRRGLGSRLGGTGTGPS